MPVAHLLIWIEPSRTEVIDALADLNSAQDVAADVITIVTPSQDAIKIVLSQHPNLIFDFATPEFVSRSRLGRALEQAYKNAQLGGANQILRELRVVYKQENPDIKEANRLLSDLARIPGKKIWAEVEAARLAILTKNLPAAELSLKNAQAIAPDFWPYLEVKADYIAARGDHETAAHFLLKNLTSHKLQSQEKIGRTINRLIEWKHTRGISVALQLWQNNKKCAIDADFSYFVANFVLMRDKEAGRNSALTHLYFAASNQVGRWEFMQKIASSLENDRYHYRAEDVWDLARTTHRANALECDLGLVRCFYEGRKMRKGDALIHEILKAHPDHPEARSILERFRRHVA